MLMPISYRLLIRNRAGMEHVTNKVRNNMTFWGKSAFKSWASPGLQYWWLMFPELTWNAAEPGDSGAAVKGGEASEDPRRARAADSFARPVAGSSSGKPLELL